jgi:hypothetical protein
MSFYLSCHCGKKRRVNGRPKASKLDIVDREFALCRYLILWDAMFSSTVTKKNPVSLRLPVQTIRPKSVRPKAVFDAVFELSASLLRDA